MNWVDLAAVAVIALSAMLAAVRGFAREVLGIGAWVGAGLIASQTYPLLQPQMRQWIGNPDIADPASFLAIFGVCLIVLSILASVLSGAIRSIGLGGIDRTLGVLFGLLRGAALIVVAYILSGMVVTAERWPDPVLQARGLPLVYRGAVWATSFVPEDFRPHVEKPPEGRETRAADLLRATPQGRATGRP